ncbi:pentatricopeptide repeat-containing protein At3g18970-like [Telopea speciosissima]|uniref:pentatricopeptide repeat-containing protein At3g18970-like n=1 Tax=Telopea speciosissima TaxID=54955 RepID=UPI001CC54114|nr:pentatricopeptide repeat-containing protein At3g18970-like [Telopea speciosissima]
MVGLLRDRFLSLLQRGQMFIDQLRQIHAQLIINGLNCCRAASMVGKLIDCYSVVSASGGMDYARLIFRYAEEPNVFIYNVMIRCMPPKEATQIFAHGIAMGKLVFDNFTYTYALGACARLSSSMGLWEGKQIHARIIKVGFTSDVTVQTTCLHFYARRNELPSARQVFDEMPVRTSASWNAMITGYCSQRRGTKDHAKEALVVFHAMLLDCNVKPTDTTMVGVLSACSHLGVLETASCVNGYVHKVIHDPENDVFIGTSLIDMYSKCGCLSSALNVFKRMKEKNILTWTAMMVGLAIHGQGKEALELFGSMEADNVRPNAVTFTCLLFACCHAGLVDEGLQLFNNMSSKFGINPQIQHYGCIVDLLSRSGHLQEAFEFIIDMPLEPDLVLWRSLLGACKVYGDVVMGEKVGKLLLQLQQEQGSWDSLSTCEDYIALSNMYAMAQRWEDVEMVRETMKVKGIQTKPGCSLVQSASLLLAEQ